MKNTIFSPNSSPKRIHKIMKIRHPKIQQTSISLLPFPSPGQPTKIS